MNKDQVLDFIVFICILLVAFVCVYMFGSFASFSIEVHDSVFDEDLQAGEGLFVEVTDEGVDCSVLVKRGFDDGKDVFVETNLSAEGFFEECG